MKGELARLLSITGVIIPTANYYAWHILRDMRLARAISQHWAWPCFVVVALLSALLQPQIRASGALLFADAALIGLVVFFGWPQLVTGISSRIYFGAILVSLLLILFLAVGLLLIPLLLLYILIDVFFVAPRRSS